MVSRALEAFVEGSMLLVVPVPFRRSGGRLLFESQACNGMNRWADNFSYVTVAAPVMPEVFAQADKTIVWEDTATVMSDRIKCIPLPWAYGLKVFLREYFRCRKILADEVRRAEFLQFAIGGLIGDWAAVAAGQARKQGRQFAIHTDRVESQLLRKLARGHSGPRAWKKIIEAALMDRYHRSIINHCSAGLWHGQECYDAYAPSCKHNYLIHDVHTKKADAITAEQIQQKLNNVVEAPELKIVYAGRMAAMKAPLEWLKAIAQARDLGIRLSATWYGDGELRKQMETELEALKLSNLVRLTGFISERQILLDGLREGHLMLFTHVTPESPRCLLEALICGTPLVGYDNAFARDLTTEHGGGSYVPMHDWKALGKRIAELSKNRCELKRLVGEAAENGSRFNDDAVFLERSMIIKTMLRRVNQEN